MYTKLCEEIFTYENQVYSEWLRDAVQVEERLLRDCLLVFRDDKLESTFDVSEKQKFFFLNYYYCFFQILFLTNFRSNSVRAVSRHRHGSAFARARFRVAASDRELGRQARTDQI